jgi:hypothetical protein
MNKNTKSQFTDLIEVMGKADLSTYGKAGDQSLFYLRREFRLLDIKIVLTAEKRTLPNYLTKLTDWVPSAAIRKRQKKLIADEMAEIFEFEAQGRMRLARWRRAWLWVHWSRYLLSSPFTWVMKVFKKTTSS